MVGLFDDELVPVSEIVRHPSLQVRQKTHPSIVQRYATAYAQGEDFSPIEVAEVDGVMVLIDGWHRLAAQESLGKGMVVARVVKAKTLEEARWLAVEANLRHGLPLTAKELRNGFRLFVRAGHHRTKWGGLKSIRDIAKELGGARHPSTVWRWFQKDFPRIAKEYGGTDDGGGGDREMKPGPTLKEIALEHIEAAAKVSEGVWQQPYRKRLLEAAQGLVRSLEGEPSEVSEGESEEDDEDF